jgi:hypothetical protein
MLDRSKADAAPLRSRALAYAVGTLVSLAVSVWLTVAGVDYVVNGCGCDEPLFGEWLGPAMLGLAAFSLVAALLLGWRAAAMARASRS